MWTTERALRVVAKTFEAAAIEAAGGSAPGGDERAGHAGGGGKQCVGGEPASGHPYVFAQCVVWGDGGLWW